jgi:iron complex transport system substrate-binding protein
MRVVSLLPSCTEIVHALGCDDFLVGRSHECDFPPEARNLPICTRSRIDSSQSSRAIHESVASKLKHRGADPLYELDGEILRQLEPDLILTQAQCDVCAIDEQLVLTEVKKWKGKNVKVVSLSPKKLPDLWTDIMSAANAMGVADRGKSLLQELKKRVVDVIEKTCVLEKRPSVCVLEWFDPLMLSGNWVPDLVEMSGGKNLVTQSGKPSATTTFQQLKKRNPDVLILVPCGFDLKRSESELPTLSRIDGWHSLKAVRENRVYLVDGNAYVNRPGPRLVDSIEVFAEILHPEKFSFEFKNKAWKHLSNN